MLVEVNNGFVSDKVINVSASILQGNWLLFDAKLHYYFCFSIVYDTFV